VCCLTQVAKDHPSKLDHGRDKLVHNPGEKRSERAKKHRVVQLQEKHRRNDACKYVEDETGEALASDGRADLGDEHVTANICFLRYWRSQRWDDYVLKIRPSLHLNMQEPKIGIVLESDSRMATGCVSAVDSEGTIWIVDIHRGDGKHFIVHSDEKLTALLEPGSAVQQGDGL
jgi:hypothetical protein